MIHYVRENILNKQVNNTYTRKNGGCVIYAKLAANIFSQIKTMKCLVSDERFG
jgi:hypothetical protein